MRLAITWEEWGKDSDPGVEYERTDMREFHDRMGWKFREEKCVEQLNSAAYRQRQRNGQILEVAIQCAKSKREAECFSELEQE